MSTFVYRIPLHMTNSPRPSPLHICILQVIKYWRWNGLETSDQLLEVEWPGDKAIQVYALHLVSQSVGLVRESG